MALGYLGFVSVINRDYPVMFATLYVFTLLGLLARPDLRHHLYLDRSPDRLRVTESVMAVSIGPTVASSIQRRTVRAAGPKTVTRRLRWIRWLHRRSPAAVATFMANRRGFWSLVDLPRPLLWCR